LFIFRHSRLTGYLFTSSYNEASERLQTVTGPDSSTCGNGTREDKHELV